MIPRGVILVAVAIEVHCPHCDASQPAPGGSEFCEVREAEAMCDGTVKPCIACKQPIQMSWEGQDPVVMASMNETICQTCNGIGFLYVHADTRNKARRFRLQRDCPACKGAGKTTITDEPRPWREVLAAGNARDDIKLEALCICGDALAEHGNDPAEDASYTNCTKCGCIAYEPALRDAEGQLAEIRTIVSRLLGTSEIDPVDNSVQHVERSILKELSDALVLMGVE